MKPRRVRVHIMDSIVEDAIDEAEGEAPEEAETEQGAFADDVPNRDVSGPSGTVSRMTHGILSMESAWPLAGRSNTSVSQTGWPFFSSVVWYQALPIRA